LILFLFYNNDIMAELKAIVKCSCGNEAQMKCLRCYTRTCRLCCKYKSSYEYQIGGCSGECIICNVCIKEVDGCIIL